MNVSRILERFRAAFRQDVDAGAPRPLSDYQRIFRGFESEITREFERLSLTEADTAEMRPRSVAPRAGVRGTEQALELLAEGAAARYEPGDEIARGGMGAILRVRDVRLNRDLAMKVILDPASRSGSGASPRATPFVDRFLAEAQLTAQLDHPGVVPVHDLGIDSTGQLFFTMKLVNGRTLGEIFDLVRRSEEQWTRTRAVQLMVRVLETLSFAHAKGVVHRDLKPANVMVGDFGEVYVMDWGLAKVLDDPDADRVTAVPASDSRGGTASAASVAVVSGAENTMAGTVLGTPAYMSPEQATGRLEDLRTHSDIYSAGAMLYELLVGAPPYADIVRSRNAMDVVLACADGPATPVLELAPEIPGEIAAIVDKAMARAPEDRYATAEDMAQDLRDFIEGRVVGAYATGPLVELRKWIGRNKPLAAAITVALVLLVAGLVTNHALLVESRIEATNARRQAYRLGMATAARAVADADRLTARAKLDDVAVSERGWEWRVLDARLDDSVYRLDARTAQFDRESRLVIVGTDDTVRRVDLETGASVELMPARGFVHALSPDGRFVVLRPSDGNGRDAGRFVVIELATGTEWATVECGENAVATFVRDAAVIFVVDRKELLRVDLRDGSTVRGERPLDGLIIDEPTIESGRLILTLGGGSGAVMLVDIDTLEVETTLSGHTESVFQAVLSPDGELLVSGGRDGSARSWLVATGEPGPWTYRTARGEDVVGLEFSPAGDYIAATVDGGTARILRTADGTVARLLPGTPRADPHFSPDGRWLVATDDQFSVVVVDVGELEDPTILRAHSSFVYDVAYAPNGKRFATAAWDGFGGSAPGCVRFWDAATSTVIGAWSSGDEWATSLDWSPDGRLLYVTLQSLVPEPQTVVLDTDTGREVGRLEGAADVVVSPDGKHVANGSSILSYAPGAYVHDTSTGARIREVPHFTNPGGGLLFVDSGLLAAGGQDAQVDLIDIGSGRIRRSLLGHGAIVFGLALSPDGSRLVSTAEDGTARVWDVATGEQIAVLEGQGAAVLGVTYSPDGTRIVTGSRDGLVHVWHAGTFEEIAALAGHESYVTALAFSPDGETLLSASGDGTVRMWTTASAHELIEARLARRTRVAAMETRLGALQRDLDTAAERVAAVRGDAALTDDDRELLLQLVLASALADAR